MTRRRWWTVGAGLVVVMVAVIATTATRPRPAAVETALAVERDRFRSYVTASGEVVPTRFADIGSSVMGRLVHLPVAEGDRVTAGQVVARIDPVQARSEADAADAVTGALRADEGAAARQLEAAAADLAQATARARDADARRARERQLHRDGLTTAAALDAAEAAAEASAAQVSAAEANRQRAQQSLAAAAQRVAQARAQAVRARDWLQKTEITSPIDGLVSRLQVREGEMVVVGIQNQPGTTLMTISDMSAVNAEVKVAEADILRVAVGQPATVTLEALPGRRFEGRVVEVGASALPTVGTAAAAREFRVAIRIEGLDAGSRPGLTCDAEILTRERTGVVTVPLQAVVLRPSSAGADDRTGVFVIDGDRARFQTVDTGIIGGLDVEVSGIAAGTRVVSGPFQILRQLADGALVRATDPPVR